MAEQIQRETRPRVVVRPAAKSERAQIADLLTQTFIHDPVMNWFGSVKFLVFDTNPEGKSSSALKTIRGLAAFYTTVVNLFFLLGANIDVAVLRDHNRGDGEKIIGVTAWFEPGKEVNPSFWTLLRARPWKVTGTWGVRALKNIFAEYEPAAEKAAKRAFVNHKGISTNLKDSWHLTVLAVDPLYESQGNASLLMREGLKRTSPKPIRLESSTAKSRYIYLYYGFEVNEEQRFGKGKVNADGIITKDENAPGVTVWNMTKWSY